VRYHGDPDPDEADRLNREARFERMDEEAERNQPLDLSPKERWVEANPMQAASLIELLQDDVRELSKIWHLYANHASDFDKCYLESCRKLRNHLREIPSLERAMYSA
jgi:hypothetical protein